MIFLPASGGQHVGKNLDYFGGYLSGGTTSRDHRGVKLHTRD